MKNQTVLLYLLATLSACSALEKDACYDMGQLWDPVNQVCSDDCAREGGIFLVNQRRCEFTSSSSVTRSQLSKELSKTCPILQKTLKDEFDMSGISFIDYRHAFELDYIEDDNIQYTYIYGFGQDGVCNYRVEDGSFVRAFVRKNAKTSSRVATEEFDVLRIERKLEKGDEAEIIWERKP